MRIDTNGVRSRFLFPASPCCLRLSPSVLSGLFVIPIDALPVVMLPPCYPHLSLTRHRTLPLQYSCKNIHSHIPHPPTSTCCYEYCRIPSSSPIPFPLFIPFVMHLCPSMQIPFLNLCPVNAPKKFYPSCLTFILVVSTFISLLVATIYISTMVFWFQSRSPSWHSLVVSRRRRRRFVPSVSQYLLSTYKCIVQSEFRSAGPGGAFALI